MSIFFYTILTLFLSYSFGFTQNVIKSNRKKSKFVDVEYRIMSKAAQDLSNIKKEFILDEYYISKRDKKFYNLTIVDGEIFIRNNRNDLLSGSYIMKDSIKFTDAVYVDKFDHLGGTYKVNIEFTNTSFLKSVEFLEVKFQKPLNFYKSSFKKRAIFYKCVFEKEVNFGYSDFSYNLKDKEVDSSILSLLYFGDEGVIFQNSIFKSPVVFNGAEFDCEVNFINTTFNSTVLFNNTKFGYKLNFNSAVFSYLPTFYGIELPDTIDFRKTIFHATNIEELNLKIDLRTSNLKRGKLNLPLQKCKILLVDTDASKFILPYSNFELAFDSTSVYDTKASIYEAIIKSCKEEGMTESAQSWDIEYRKFQLNHDWPFFCKFIIAFNQNWWDFGYEKWRILIFWLPFFFICFLTWNYFRLLTLWTYMYKDHELGKVFRKPRTHIEPPKVHGWKRFSFAFFYTAVIYFGFKIRHEAVNYEYTRGLLYLYLMYAVGTIHMAFAFSYIISAY